jgi:DNA polymerase elongation subunit (family B)
MDRSEEIKNLKEKIQSLTALKNEYKNEEQGIKLTMNSIYGAIGNNYFACFNPDVAEAVTLQGQDLIKYSSMLLTRYFHEFWHLDTELHEMLGISTPKKVVRPILTYIDTDSNYITFQEVVKSCDYKGDAKELILKINEYRLKEYLRKSFDKYALKWNTKNYQDFELETFSKSAIFLGKKKYVADLIYEDGVHIESLSRLKIIGVEMIKGGTPPFVREKLTYLTKYIFSKGSSFVLRDFVQELKEIKKDFKMQEPRNISNAIAVNNYEKFVLNDTTNFEVGKACPIHVRASGFHNYILNNSKYKDKYQLIKSSQKVNFYFVKTKSERENNVFAYPQGVFPYEFAPPLDYDEQFTKTILDPINRFIEAMGHNPISPNLFMVKVLF